MFSSFEFDRHLKSDSNLRTPASPANDQLFADCLTSSNVEGLFQGFASLLLSVLASALLVLLVEGTDDPTWLGPIESPGNKGGGGGGVGTAILTQISICKISHVTKHGIYTAHSTVLLLLLDVAQIFLPPSVFF